MEKKALQLASVASMIDLFNTDNINILRSLGYSVDVATNFEDGSITSQERVNEYRKELKEQGIGTYQIPIPRSLKRVMDIIISYKMVKMLVNKNHYRIVHCHSPIGGVLCRLACRKARKSGTKVIYTAHGFHFYKGASKASWMIYYPIEKWMSRYTDILITINHEDYQRAKKRFYAKKTVYVPGVGIDMEQFHSGLVDKEEKRRKLGLENTDIMLLSVGELSKRKNHEAVIQAVHQLANPGVRYFICGKGKLEGQLRSLIKHLGMEKQVKLLGHRTDISELCQASDLFVFPSLQEGLPVALMEAIACKTPVICSNIQENTDLIPDSRFLFDAKDVDLIWQCMENALRLGREGKESAIDMNYRHLRAYSLNSVGQRMEELYQNVEGYPYRLNAFIARARLENEYGLDEESTVFLSVGELNRNKNHAVAIRALAGLANRNLHYFIAGKGNLGGELMELAGRLGISRQVHLLGYRTDVPDLMRASDVYLLPSVREGLNVSLMEAMAAGLPCVCSDIRGNRDLIKNGAGGYLADALDVAAWQEAISKVLDKGQDPGNRNSGRIGRKFSKLQVQNIMEKVYMQC